MDEKNLPSMKNIWLFDRYARALKTDPKLTCQKFAEQLPTPRVPSTVKEAFTRLEVCLHTILIPRRLDGMLDARGRPFVANTWHDALYGPASQSMVRPITRQAPTFAEGAQVQRNSSGSLHHAIQHPASPASDGKKLKTDEPAWLDHERIPGLTPDGRAWAIYASMMVSQFVITKNFLQQKQSRLGHFSRAPLMPVRESIRIGNINAIEDRAAAMRHVADCIEDNGPPKDTALLDLLNEGSADRKKRLARGAFKAMAQRRPYNGETDSSLQYPEFPFDESVSDEFVALSDEEMVRREAEEIDERDG